MEYEQLPACCKKAVEEINEKLKIGKELEIVLALAPASATTFSFRSPLSAIWFLAKSGYNCAKFREDTNKKVSPIIQGTIKKIIDNEIFNHSIGSKSNYELRLHWDTMKKAFMPPK
jgi:hypothetical protein